MTLYKELEKHMKTYSDNFHLDKQDYQLREIIKVLCELVDKRFRTLDITAQEAERIAKTGVR